jgi:hypothetical protein
MYKIKALPKDEKNKAFQKPIMKKGIIPGFPTSTIICGSSGSGKTTLLTRLLMEPYFYGPPENGKPYFDNIFIFSKTAGPQHGLDDTYDNITYLTDDNFITEISEENLTLIMEIQKENIKTVGRGKAKRVLIIFDDILSEPKFLNSGTYTKLFTELRHYNCSIICNTQSFNSIPRRCRIQAMNIMLFGSSRNEQKVLADFSAPDNISSRKFIKCIQHCTSEPYSFMYINRELPSFRRVSRNIDDIVDLEPYYEVG